MWICTQAFHVPKRGNAEDEYEDAFFPENGFYRDPVVFRCAVADGASESAFAREWAEMLVRSFGRRRLRLKHLQDLWRRLVSGRPLPWYLEAKIPRGSHAALVGLSIRNTPNGRRLASASSRTSEPPSTMQVFHGVAVPVPGAEAPGSGAPGPDTAPDGVWTALAIGDSCLFQIRESTLVTTGPVANSADFGNTPMLLSTKCPSPIPRGADHVFVLSGSWRSKDAFYLASDALSQWLLAEHEAGRSHWALLNDLGTDAEQQPFAALVDDLRESGRLHNDDTTLLRIEVA